LGVLPMSQPGTRIGRQAAKGAWAMQERPGLSTLKIVLIVVGCVGGGFLLLAGVGVALVVPALQRANELTNRTVCMSNLKSIGSALILYKGCNDNQWPWLTDKCADWEINEVGLNRQVKSDPNSHPERSVTGMMFLLVRDNQPAKLFVCPSTGDVNDVDIKDMGKVGSDGEPEYLWDFSGPDNVSYSWQAPVKGKDGKYRQGLNDNDNDTVVIADKTPRWCPQPWNNAAWDPVLTGSAVRPHMSQNHSLGDTVNVLYVGINVSKQSRPDIGMSDAGRGGLPDQPGMCDMIYTASGKPTSGSAKATSISIADHLSTRDTFLIGPVAAPKGGAEAKGK
jgi:hypothetical protein